MSMADEYWHNVAMRDEMEHSFFDWVMESDARLQAAYDWYKGYDNDALHELVVDYLDEKFVPQEVYTTFEGDDGFGVRDKETNELLFVSEESSEVNDWIDDNINTWNDETYDIWYDAAKKSINELGYYQFQDYEEELEESSKNISNFSKLKALMYTLMKYLDENKVSYRDMDFQEVTDAWGKLFIIVEGDWKHDHLYIDYMVDEWFNQNGIQYINGGTQVLDDGESDYYAGKHEYRIILRSIDYDIIADAYKDSAEYKSGLEESINLNKHTTSVNEGIIDDFLKSCGIFENPETATVFFDSPTQCYIISLNEHISWKDFKIFVKQFKSKFDAQDKLDVFDLGPDNAEDVQKIGIALNTTTEDDVENLGFNLDENNKIKESLLQEIHDGHMYLLSQGFTDEQIDKFCELTKSTLSELLYSRDWFNAFEKWTKTGELPKNLKLLGENAKITSKKISEDTVKKSNGKWTNRGDDGKEHGEFKTKKEADKQRKAMYANGYTGESRRNNMSITIRELKETSGINMKTSIKDWYMKEFPDDDLGERINSTVNFDDILNALQNHTDIYDVIDVVDSVIRERIFDKLSKLINKDYNYIYNLWLGESLHESSPITKDSSSPYFRAFVTNLGKYNEGQLVGEWVTFPIDEDDFDEVLKRIQIGDTDDFGAPYEEWFVTDYECDLDGFDWQELGEYPSYDSLQEYGELIESIDDVEAVENAYEVTGDLREAIEGIDSGSIIYYPGCNTEEELGEYVINEIYGGEITPDLAEQYFDYDKLGRDLGFDEYENDNYDPDDEDSEEYISAGEYWCGDEYASDSDIGAAYVDAVGFDGVSNIENYFDYEAFGRDLTFESFTLTKDGAIEYT